MANKPNNPALWSRAKSMAKQKFDVYPSAYANGWAAKWYKGKGGTWRKAKDGIEVPSETTSMNFSKPMTFGMPAPKPIPLGFNLGLDQNDLYNLRYNVSATGERGDDRFSVTDPRHQVSLSLLDGVLGKGKNLNITGTKSKNFLDFGLRGSTPFLGGNLSVSGNYNYQSPNKSSDMERESSANFMRVPQNRSSFGVNTQWEGKALGKKGPNTRIGFTVGNSGNPMMKYGGTDNPGFRALPPEVQEKIMDNMAQGGQKMPPEIARARFAAAGNLDQMADYGYAYGGYIPEMMYGGNQYMQQGGEQEQIMQLIQMYAQMSQIDPAELMQQLQQMPPEEQQQAIQQMVQTLEQAGSQQQPDMTQAAMAYGGYTTGIFAEGGEPNGSMALGQMSAVSDKMNKLRQFVSPEQYLDPWIASKLAVMDDSADAISDYMMYNPEAQDTEMMQEDYDEDDMMQEMSKGGYTVTRSNDRKGKTHKVTGPDGTVKYFGDSKLGQHPKDPERKAAFYARHKKNLDGNPYFRAFARATWKDGGSTFSGNAFYEDGGEPRMEDYPDYGSWRADLLRYNAGQMNTQEAAAQQAPMQEEPKVMWHPEWEEQGIDPETQLSAPKKAAAAPITYSGVSIVDLLSSVGKASDYNSRKQLAAQLGIDNYYGSAKQNLELIKKVTSNPDVLNDYKPVAKPRSGSTTVSKLQGNNIVTTTNSNGVVTKKETVDPVSQNLNELKQSNALDAIFAQQKKAYMNANPGMTEQQYEAAMAANRPKQSFIGPASKPLLNTKFDYPYRSASDSYDDSYMLNKIANDPETPGNVRARKQKEFAMTMGSALLAAALPNLAITRYYPLLRGLPQFSSAASRAARALPQGAKALPKPGPTNWVTNSGLSFKEGGINLDPAKKGTFKAQATRMGMGVQEAASAILNAPEGKYSPAMRKKANFAKNFAKQMGGPVEGEVLDVSPEQLEALRQQGYQFEIM